MPGKPKREPLSWAQATPFTNSEPGSILEKFCNVDSKVIFELTIPVDDNCVCDSDPSEREGSEKSILDNDEIMCHNSYENLKISKIFCNAILLNRHESLLFITVQTQDVSFKALIDSRATRTFIGPKGIELVEKLNFNVIETTGRVQFANGGIETVSKEIIRNLCN